MFYLITANSTDSHLFTPAKRRLSELNEEGGESLGIPFLVALRHVFDGLGIVGGELRLFGWNRRCRFLRRREIQIELVGRVAFQDAEVGNLVEAEMDGLTVVASGAWQRFDVVGINESDHHAAERFPGLRDAERLKHAAELVA